MPQKANVLLADYKAQEGESLRDYVKNFNKAILKIDKADN